jgi:DNA-directed RNA polymerase subunit beta'
MKRLVSDGIAHNIKSAKRMVERAKDEVWDVLEGVIKEHPVLLNRAPTLHRLGIQAFEPVLTEGRALKLHPLACTAYNADFDGDQMAIHLPLSAEAQAEARVLMLAANHILAPKDGGPIIVPSQDMVLGSYYLTAVRNSSQGRPIVGEGKIFTGINEALLAYQHQELDIQAEIKVRMKDVDEDGNVVKDYGLVRTSLGRMIFNETLPKAVRQFSQDKKTGEWSLGMLMNKKQLGKLVDICFKTLGASETAVVIDNVKNLGYHYACIAGMTVAISDIKVPEKKQALLDEAEAKVKKTQRQFERGLISDEERYKKVCKVWDDATNLVADAMYDNYADNEPFNPIYMMADSGARGNKSQMRQLAGMRGLMADPSGKTIEIPITANFREGLSVSDYFISSHGARKGLADTALRTADSGYLTRRLVDVAQDVIVREEDCDVVGINLIRERAKLAESAAAAVEQLKETLVGRILASDVISPETAEVIVEKGVTLDEEILKTIGEAGVAEITLRGSSSNSDAAITNAAATDTVKLGAPDENIRKSIKSAMVAEMMGKDTTAAVVDSQGVEIVPAGVPLTEEYIEAVLSSDAKEVKVRNNNIRGIEVEAIVEGSGVIEPLKDRIVGRVLAEDIINPETGEKVASINDDIDEKLADEIVKVRNKVSIRSVLTCKSQYGVCIKCYGRDLANATKVNVGEAVGIIAAQSIGEPGTQLTMRTFHSGGVAGGDDITQGLPRVEELFEARKPKHNAIIAEIEGDVTVTEKDKIFTVTITPKEGKEKAKEYVLPFNSRLATRDGDHIMPGDKLTEGSINPHDILRVCGLKETQNYLVYEVQKVYKQQGVGINDKHIEVMVRQMLHKVRIEAYGGTDFLPGEYVDINSFEAANTKAIAEGKEPAVAKPILLGITKAALATDSFLSAASFQETTRVLTDAAIKGKVDPLLGLKENVIIGKLIPAGTGMGCYRNIKVVYENEPEQTVEAEAEAEAAAE